MVEPIGAARTATSSTVDLRVSALSRASERILRQAGAWPAIETHVCPYSDMVVWDAAGRLDGRDTLRFSAAEAGEPNLGYIAENLRVQWALHESPQVRDVTQLRAGLEALEFDEDSARVTLSDGRRYSCALVVGADGGQFACPGAVRHRPRRLVLWPGRGRGAPAHGAVASRDGLPALPAGRTDGVAAAARRAGVAGVDDDTGGGGIAAGARASEFSRRVTAASDRVLGAVALDSGRAGLPLALWHSREYVRPRLALVGDAAHTIHPLAGQGVNLGFLDCATLVEVLGDAVADGDDPFALRNLRRYERWRRSENALMLGLTDTINRVFAQKSVAVAGARRLGLALVANQPFARRALVQRALGLAGDLPALVTRPG